MYRLTRVASGAFAFALLSAGAASAQSGKFYQPVAASNAAGISSTYEHYRLVRQDIPSLTSYVRSTADAALKGTAAETPVTLPMPDGHDVIFLVQEVETLSPELAAENPDLHTFCGASADKHYKARLTTSPMGAIASITGSEGEMFYVTPLSNKNPDVLISYDARGLKGMPAAQCGINDALISSVSGSAGPQPLWGDGNIRTYRLAVAATGEYTSWAGSQANALTQITATINAVNGIYERDLAIHFTLVSPNSILFTSASTDPYSLGTVSGTTLTENQTTLDNATYLGSANYDVGMVLTAASSGGLAAKPSACSSGGKGQNASGFDPTNFPTGPSGMAFILTVAHEVGHQFNASHSFAANTGSCSGNTSGSTGWEPGGGSTIMAYAGTCTGLAYQQENDAYFHGGNLSEMSAYMTSGTGSTCATLTTNTNSAPTATTSGGTSFTIPASTPFQLRASTSQTASDVLTHTYDEIDAIGGSGTASAPSPTNTTGPMFRSFPPSTNNVQYFPSLAALVGINSSTYEMLPSVARTMNFRLTVRDNASYTSSTAGRTANQDVAVTTVACATPFAVTSQSASGSFTANGTNTMTVTWNTATSCATCSNVNIRFSRDGGRSFPYVLQSSTTNDGTETITVPNLTTDRGRIMVECANNIHFNINAATQTVTSTCAAEGTSFTPDNDLYSSTAGSATLNQTLSPIYGTALASSISGSLTTTDDSNSLVGYNTSTSTCTQYTGNRVKYDSYRLTPGTTASYTFTRSGSGLLIMALYDSAYLPTSPCRNLIASTYELSTNTNSGTLTTTLSKNKAYVLVITSFNGTNPALPAAYTITYSGGSLYTAVPNPGAAFNYSYVIVNSTTGLIKSIQSTGDMSNSATFSAGNYNVYGLSSSTSTATLNTTYAGTSFTSFRTAVQNQTGGLCASLSSNTRRVGIVVATPAVIVSFDGRLTGKRKSLLYWEAADEDAIRSYELQRSYDGKNFETVATLRTMTGFSGNYNQADGSIAQSATEVFYRLVVNQTSGGTLQSGIVRMKLDAEASRLAINPNPVQNEVLQADVFVAAEGSVNIQVVDLTGRVIISRQQQLEAGNQHISTPLGGLAPGMYLLKLSGESLDLVQRFVKP